MAQVTGRREVVQDPLRQSANQILPDRSVPMSGVRGPGMPSMQGVGQQASELDTAMAGLQGVLAEAFDEKKDEWITEGKSAYMAGVTEAELLKNGNRYTQMGYLQLKVRNDVNEWYLQENADLVDKKNTMDPTEYQGYLSERRKSYLDGISDPYAKKVAVAAFEQFNPQLTADQFTQNNAYNMQQRGSEFMQFLDTGSVASPSAGKVIPGETSLKISPTPVEPVMTLSARDRDIGIKTMIGEAGNQGDFGMAAVAHVIRNRATDSKFPNSIAGVALQENQFSVWNKGKEGNPRLHKLGPGNATYDKAAKVFDAVMGGRHVDPTGGALYYYSPSGMQAYKDQGIQNHLIPKWAREQEAQNLVVIGAHRFSGRTDGAQRSPRDMVEPVEQGDLGPTSLTDEVAEFEQTSEYKSRFPGMEQFPGKVADDLLPSTAGTPAGNTLDQMNEQAAVNEGVAGVREAGAPNEVLDFIMNYKGLPDDQKAKYVSTSMARQLDAGNDQLFNDAGGVSILYKLGADPADVDRVMKARERYETEQEKKFDAEDIQFEDDILRLAGDGKTSLADINKRIEDRIAAGGLLDEQGKSLARAAASQMRAEDKQKATKADAEAERQAKIKDSVFSDPSFLKEIGGVHQQIKTGAIDNFEDAQAEATKIAERYGADADDVAKVLARVFELDQGRQDSMRQRAAAEHAKAAESNERKAEAERAIAKGYGLKDATGDVKITNADGHEVKLSAKEYGIELIKAQAKEKYGQNVPAISNDVFTKLQQQQVIDPQTQQQFVAAVKGNFVDEKKGTVSKDAQEAYDLYQLLKTNPRITDEFLADQVGDAYTRNLFALAYRLDAGNQTGPEALIRAKAMMDKGSDIDPNATIARDAVFNTEASKASRDLVTELASPSFWSTKAFFATFDPKEIERAVSTGAAAVERTLKSYADTYHIQYPGQDPAVSLELAKADVKRDTKVVAGNVIITKDKLHEKMGLKNDHADDAIKTYVEKFGASMFGEVYNTKHAQALSEAGSVFDVLPGGQRGLQRHVPLKVQWLPNVGENGAFRIGLIDDVKTGKMVGREAVIPAERIGGYYINQEKQPNALQNIFTKTKRKIAEDVRPRAEAMGAAEAGAGMGALFGK
ncbi:cell wall hydrolase SleB-like protein [Rhizobium phage RHph_X3_9]|nr:cell wall hydrolase SleB-like protein [Rhizobium phage RHph_X3_9]